MHAHPLACKHTSFYIYMCTHELHTHSHSCECAHHYYNNNSKNGHHLLLFDFSSVFLSVVDSKKCCSYFRGGFDRFCICYEFSLSSFPSCAVCFGVDLIKLIWELFMVFV